MSHRILFLVAVLILAGATSTNAIVLRHDRALVDTEAAGSRFPATVRFLPDGSGALVASDWVLTAAHVARGLSPFGQEVEVSGHRGVIAQVVFHPLSNRLPGQAPEVDAALVQLRGPLDHVTPASLYVQGDEVGQRVHVAGYGDFGLAGDAEMGPANGVCRVVSNRVDHLRGNYLAITFDDGDGATELEGTGAPGDSGGPLFIERDGVRFVAGISSFSTGPPRAYGSVDHYTRVSNIADWIRLTLADTTGLAQPVVTDLTRQSFSDAAQSAVAQAFVHAFNAGDEDFLQFAADHPQVESLRRLVKRRAMYGELTALRWAVLDPQRSSLLVSLGAMGGHRVINFWFDERGALRDIALGMSAAPNPITED